MPILIDITGQKIGRWLVLRREGIKFYPSGAKQPLYLCKCECGTEKHVAASILRSKQSKSCGCLNREVSMGYQNGNCEWIPLSDQQKNKTNSSIKCKDDLLRVIRLYCEATDETPDQLIRELHNERSCL